MDEFDFPAAADSDAFAFPQIPVATGWNLAAAGDDVVTTVQVIITTANGTQKTVDLVGRDGGWWAPEGIDL